MRRTAKQAAGLLSALALASCATASPVGKAGASAPTLAIDSNFPDPAAIKAADGAYYVYATQGEHDGKMQNIQIARSRDLMGWVRVGDALPVKPIWAKNTQDFWAPHVSAHDGRYYLYYSAKPDVALVDKVSGFCLAVATADRPEGPFTDMGKPLLCGDSFINIDPMAYDDPATGKRLLYWGSGFGPIKVQELAMDRMSFASGSAPIDLVQVDKTEDPKNYQRLVEGAWVVRNGGYYYMFYSGDNCCGPKAHYAVLVARSRSATGPFELRRNAKGEVDNVVIEASGNWVAPGHNAVIEDKSGKYWFLYHAVDSRKSRTTPTDDVNTRRIMLVERLKWKDGWPTVSSE